MMSVERHTEAADPKATVSVVQRIRYSYAQPVPGLRQRLMVVPPAEHGAQRRGDWGVKVRGVADFKSSVSRDRDSNTVVEVRTPRVDSWIEFLVDCVVEFRDHAGPPQVAVGRRFLTPTLLTAAGSRVQRLASRAQADPAAICAVVHEALSYEYGVTGVHTSAEEALACGRGVCQDFAQVMLAVCRAKGMAARYVSGHLLGEGGSHAWVEVLVPDPASSSVWLAQAWDPTHNRRTSRHYVTVAVGADYAEVAPLSGTFEGPYVRSELTVSKRAGERQGVAAA
jgi:transglutaminase-like putative cysteine protease